MMRISIFVYFVGVAMMVSAQDGDDHHECAPLDPDCWDELDGVCGSADDPQDSTYVSCIRKFCKESKDYDACVLQVSNYDDDSEDDDEEQPKAARGSSDPPLCDVFCWSDQIQSEKYPIECYPENPEDPKSSWKFWDETVDEETGETLMVKRECEMMDENHSYYTVVMPYFDEDTNKTEYIFGCTKNNTLFVRDEDDYDEALHSGFCDESEGY